MASGVVLAYRQTAAAIIVTLHLQLKVETFLCQKIAPHRIKSTFTLLQSGLKVRVVPQTMTVLKYHLFFDRKEDKLFCCLLITGLRSKTNLFHEFDLGTINIVSK